MGSQDPTTTPTELHPPIPSLHRSRPRVAVTGISMVAQQSPSRLANDLVAPGGMQPDDLATERRPSTGDTSSRRTKHWGVIPMCRQRGGKGGGPTRRWARTRRGHHLRCLGHHRRLSSRSARSDMSHILDQGEPSTWTRRHRQNLASSHVTSTR